MNTDTLDLRCVAAQPPLELEDGLMLREASPADRDALGALLARVHAGADGAPNLAVQRWQRDLFDRGHPTVRSGDMLVVQDMRTGALASSFMMIPQTWSYEGVAIPVSLLELAATDPDFRGRGLLKQQLQVLVARSARRGDLVQGMTDILFFGPDIGFHMAVTQRAGRGGRICDLPVAPPRDEPVRIRRAGREDLGTLIELDRRTPKRGLLACLRGEAEWRHELSGRSLDSMVHDELLIVDSPAGPVGFLVLGYGAIPSFPIPSWLPGRPCPEPWTSVARFELLREVSWSDVTPSVLRQLGDWSKIGTEDNGGFMLWLGSEHPAYDVLGDILVRRPPQMGWFLRVPDIVALLTAITPVLERRLRDTSGDSFTGELKLHFYRHGVRLRFRCGRLADIEPWPEHSRRSSDASLPEPMFLQLLFGHAKWDELAVAFPDCRLQTTAAELLLPRLFPKQSCNVWPLI